MTAIRVPIVQFLELRTLREFGGTRGVLLLHPGESFFARHILQPQKGIFLLRNRHDGNGDNDRSQQQ